MPNGAGNAVRRSIVVATHATLALLLAGCGERTTHYVAVTYTCLDFNGITGVCARWNQRAELVIAENANQNDEEGGGCFPADAVVFSREGPRKISELVLGDEVLGYNAEEGKPVFTAVRSWLHLHPTADTPMLELHTQAGNSFVASPGHMVALEKDSIEQHGSQFVRARELSPGDTLITGSGRTDTVAAVKEVQGRGLYAPLTYTSNLFVGGAEMLTSNVSLPDAHHGAVLVHSFAHVSEPQRFERAWHLMLSAVEHIAPSWAEVSATHDANGYVHPLARLFMRLLGIAPIENIVVERELDGVTGRKLAGKGGSGGSGNDNDEQEERKALLVAIIAGVLGLPPFMGMPPIRPEPSVEDIHLDTGADAPSAVKDDDKGLPPWAIIFIIAAGLVTLCAFSVIMRKRREFAERSFSGILNVRGGSNRVAGTSLRDVAWSGGGPADPNYPGEVVVGEVVGVSNNNSNDNEFKY